MLNNQKFDRLFIITISLIVVMTVTPIGGLFIIIGTITNNVDSLFFFFSGATIISIITAMLLVVITHYNEI